MLEAARAAYQHLLVRLKLSAPEYASLVTIEPITPEELQNDVLDDETTLVAYHVHARPTPAWVIDRDTFQMVAIDLGREALAGHVDHFRNLIAAQEPQAESIAGTLHRHLIAPLLPHVRHCKLIILAHGPLHRLPFAALRDGERGRYLVEDYSVTYVPSASVLRFLASRQTPDEGRALVLGNPDGSLPHAATEATTIARLLGTSPVLGAAATESLVYAQAGRIDTCCTSAPTRPTTAPGRFSATSPSPPTSSTRATWSSTRSSNG